MKKAGAVSDSEKKIRPALTPEAEEDQMIALAVNLVKQRLINGTASSQETTHFLKLGSTKAKLEKKILEQEVELKAAKTESIKASQRSEELYQEAIKAFRSYSGQEVPDDEGDY